MRVFTSECKDTATKYSMVLSECSYNMAMDWLERTLKKYGAEIAHVDMVEQTNGSKVALIHTSKDGKACRNYFYDGERGVLLGE